MRFSELDEIGYDFLELWLIKNERISASEVHKLTYIVELYIAQLGCVFAFLGRTGRRLII